MTFFKNGGVLPLILLLAGGLALFAAIGLGGSTQALHEGDTVTATISDLSTREERNRSSSNIFSTSTIYTVRVIHPGGTASEDVSGNFFRDLEQGQQIAIRVASGVVEIEPGSTSSNMLAAWIIAALAIPGGLLLAWMIRRKMAAATELQTQGRAVTATIAETVASTMGVKLRLTYLDENGTAREALLPQPAFKDFGSSEPGATHALRYLPGQPETAEFQYKLDRLSLRP